MTSVARTGWEATGWKHPSPGDPAAARQLSDSFTRKTDELRMVRAELARLPGELIAWRGQAAGQFSHSLVTVVRAIDELIQRYDRCATAMFLYADGMEIRGHESTVLLRQVLEALRLQAEAERAIAQSDGFSVDRLSWGLSAATRSTEQLAVLGVRWAAIREAHVQAVVRCGRSLEDADGNVLQDAYTGFAVWATTTMPGLFHASDTATRWLEQHANDINDVADAIDDVASELGDDGRSDFFPVGALTVGLAFLANEVRSIAWQYGADVDESEITWGDVRNILHGLSMFSERLGSGGEVVDYLSQKLDQLETLERMLVPFGFDRIAQSIPSRWSPTTVVPQDSEPSLTKAFWDAVTAAPPLLAGVVSR